MIKNNYSGVWMVALAVLTGLFSCTDAYDDHYGGGDGGGGVATQSLKELIEANGDLSAFAQLITKAELGSTFASNQTFTVWAPENGALSDVDVEAISREEARLIVENHMARFNNSTATPDNKPIRMKDNKSFFFTEGATHFGGAKLVKHDILATNGLLHTLETQIPYRPNLYEYILNNANTSKLAAFISSFQEEVVDVEASTATDTVRVPYNRLFDASLNYGYVNLGVGHINNEDSLYTMLVPTNTAWDAAYSRISPYFKGVDGASDSLQRHQTALAILDDLIYQGVIENPEAQESLISTSPSFLTGWNSVIGNPAELFANTTKIQASNGRIFQTDNLAYNSTETWNKWIVEESEIAQGRELSANTSLQTRLVDDNFPFPVSNSRYIYVEGTISSANPGVTFEIPNVLSGAYNIYVEFLPLYLDRQGREGNKTKMLFELTYMGANGRSSTRLVQTANLVTSDTEPIQMLAFSNFEFPVANCYDRVWWIDYYKGLHTLEERVVTTKLLVKTNVSVPEVNSGTYVRKFCIDRIIFEPVQH